MENNSGHLKFYYGSLTHNFYIFSKTRLMVYKHMLFLFIYPNTTEFMIVLFKLFKICHYA